MRKAVVSLLLVAMLLCTCVSVYAESEDQSESEFERVLLSRGSLISKVFISQGSISTIAADLYNVRVQAATINDLETNTAYYAARFEHNYYLSQYNSGTSVGVLDYNEIADAITTLEYIKAHQQEMVDYSEIVYTATSGLRIGAYKDGRNSYLFIWFSANDTAYIELSSIDEVIERLRSVQNFLTN